MKNKHLKQSRIRIHNKYLLFFLSYTVLSLLMLRICFEPFHYNGKGFGWIVDSLPIQLPMLAELRNFVRGIGAALSSGIWEAPLYDFRLGLGGDVIANLAMWYLEPFSWIAVLADDVNLEALYDFLAMFRLYFCGLSFAMYCFYKKRDNLLPVLCGAFIYTYTGWTFFFLRHPIFYTVLAYLPLLLIGVEEILKKRRGLFFSLLIFLSAVTHYYYLYINTIFIGVYFLVRYIKKENKTWREFFQIAFGLIWRYCLGIGLAMAVLLPNITVFLNSNRRDPVIETGNLFKFEEGWLTKIVLSLTDMSTPGYFLHNGFAALGIVCLIILIFLKKRYWDIKIFCILTAVCFSMPLFTFVFHGFSAVHFRWNYMIGMLAGYAAVIVLDRMDKLTLPNLLPPAAFMVLYILLQVWQYQFSSWSSIVGILFLAISILLLFFMVSCRDKSTAKIILQSIMLILVCINSYLTAKDLFDPAHQDYVSEFADKGQSIAMITSSSGAAADQIADDDFYRVDSANTAVQNENAALFLDMHGISSYVNVMDRRFAEYGNGLENIGTGLLDNVNNDNRTILDTLESVKYFTAYDDEKAYIPYGYSLLQKAEVNDRECGIYKNNYALPLGYTYDRFIPREEYERLSSLEKQEALLQAVVVEEASAAPTKLEKCEFKSNVIREKNVKITGKDCVYDPKTNRVQVFSHGGYLTITFPGRKDCETYLRLKNLNIDEYKNTYWTCSLFEDTRKLVKRFEVRSDTATYTYNRYNYLLNLGYSQNQICKVNLGFPVPGEFSLEEIEVFYQPMKNYGQEVGRLGRESLKEIEQSVNKIQGSITVSDDKLLVLSLPYSTGWRAYIDGKETEIECVNVAFQGIMLPKGTHEIEFHYRTPGLIAGLIITFVCLVLLIVMIVLWNKKYQRRSDTNESKTEQNQENDILVMK